VLIFFLMMICHDGTPFSLFLSCTHLLPIFNCSWVLTSSVKDGASHPLHISIKVFSIPRDQSMKFFLHGVFCTSSTIYPLSLQWSLGVIEGAYTALANFLLHICGISCSGEACRMS
jgi:hypothetical protein